MYIYIYSDHIMATCFDHKTVIFRPIENICKVQQSSTQWDLNLFTVKVTIAYEELLFETKTLK